MDIPVQAHNNVPAPSVSNLSGPAAGKHSKDVQHCTASVFLTAKFNNLALHTKQRSMLIVVFETKPTIYTFFTVFLWTIDESGFFKA